jgi:hypothetical protein
MLSITVLAEVLFVIAISILGVLELASLGYMPVLAILGYTLLVTFLINDPVKVYLIRKFKTSVGRSFGQTWKLTSALTAKTKNRNAP